MVSKMLMPIGSGRNGQGESATTSWSSRSVVGSHEVPSAMRVDGGPAAAGSARSRGCSAGPPCPSRRGTARGPACTPPRGCGRRRDGRGDPSSPCCSPQGAASGSRRPSAGRDGAPQPRPAGAHEREERGAEDARSGAPGRQVRTLPPVADASERQPAGQGTTRAIRCLVVLGVERRGDGQEQEACSRQRAPGTRWCPASRHTTRRSRSRRRPCPGTRRRVGPSRE